MCENAEESTPVGWGEVGLSIWGTIVFVLACWIFRCYIKDVRC